MKLAAVDDEMVALVRRVDPDRFFCALFAPAPLRPALWLLAAFSHELARARLMVREPAMAHIRLQWWRDVIEGADRRHPVAQPLLAAVRAGVFDPAGLLRMVDGREIEAEDEVSTLVEWREYLRATQGELAAQAGRLLGIADLDRLRSVGAAYGAGWLLRSHRAFAAQGRCLLPADVLARHGLLPSAVVQRPEAPAITAALDELADVARGWLARGWAGLPRSRIAAALPGVLARRDLRRVGQPAGPRGLGDRLAVLAAFVRG